MAAPITWHNVNGPSLADASRPMEIAQRSFGSSFDKLGEMLKQRETIDQQNVVRARTDSQNAYLDAMGNAKTPEELAAMRDQLSQQFQALDPRARAAVRGADEARLTSLQQQTTVGNAFQDQITKRTQDPLRDEYKLAYLNGNNARMAEIEATPGMKDVGGLRMDSQNYARTLLDHKQTDAMRPLLLEKTTQEIEASKATVAYNKAMATSAAETSAFNQQQKVEAALAQAAERVGAVKSQSMESTAGQKVVNDLIDKRAGDDPKLKTAMLNMVSAGMLQARNENRTVLVSDMVEAINASKDDRTGWGRTIFNNDSGIGKGFSDTLKLRATANDNASQKSYDASMTAAKEQYDRFRKLATEDDPAAAAGKSGDAPDVAPATGTGTGTGKPASVAPAVVAPVAPPSAPVKTLDDRAAAVTELKKQLLVTQQAQLNRGVIKELSPEMADFKVEQDKLDSASAKADIVRKMAEYTARKNGTAGRDRPADTGLNLSTLKDQMNATTRAELEKRLEAAKKKVK